MPKKSSLLLLPSTGFLRLRDVLRFIPVSKTAWWVGVRNGDYPKPITLGKRVTAWRAEDIHELIDKLNEQAECA